MGVVSMVVFPFPIVDPYPDFKPSINLIPFDSRFCDPRILPLCIRNLYENILLTIPFGFGINFIARIKSKNIFWLAIAVGFTFEFIQLIISLIIRNSFRVVDINDAMLNATGVLLGYVFFLAFGRLYIFVIDKFDIQHKFVFAYVYDVVNQSR